MNKVQSWQGNVHPFSLPENEGPRENGAGGAGVASDPRPRVPCHRGLGPRAARVFPWLPRGRSGPQEGTSARCPRAFPEAETASSHRRRGWGRGGAGTQVSPRAVLISRQNRVGRCPSFLRSPRRDGAQTRREPRPPTEGSSAGPAGSWDAGRPPPGPESPWSRPAPRAAGRERGVGTAWGGGALRPAVLAEVQLVWAAGARSGGRTGAPRGAAEAGGRLVAQGACVRKAAETQQPSWGLPGRVRWL